MCKNLNFFLLVIFSTFVSAIDLSQLSIDKGFNITIFANGLDAPRQMAEGKNGVIFVGERGGKIVALIDTDSNGVADSRIIVADGLTYSTGISLYDGDLYFSEISKIWKIENIDNWIKDYDANTPMPEKVIVLDNLPDEQWHGWKWIKHDQDGALFR